MDDVVKDFVKAQTDCYRGVGVLLEWIVPTYSQCRQDVSIQTRDMCSLRGAFEAMLMLNT